MHISKRYDLLLIILIGSIPRLLDLGNVSAIEMDGISYAWMAENFARGSFNEGLKGYFHPFYPIFMAIFSFVVGDMEINGRLLSLIFGILLIYFTFVLLKRFFGEKKALYGSFFVAIHPYLIRYSVQVLSESMSIFLFTAAVFFFYKGWKGKDGIGIALAGIFLALTYLNKAEYIIYALPFCLLLAKERRILHIFILIACVALVSFPYVYYLKIETGLWTITKKVAIAENAINNGIISYSYTAPFASYLQLFHRFPNVVYNFFEAVFPPFFILVVLGFKRVDIRYRTMAIMLVVLHIIARVVFAPHSTKRYSVEFIPLLMIFAVEGIYVLKDLFNKCKYKKVYYYGALAFIVVASLFQAIISPNKGRIFHKQAGLYLLNNDPGKKIMARLPIAPFYAKGQFIDITKSENAVECSRFMGLLKDTGAKYIIFDDRMEGNPLFKNNCLSNFKLIKEFRDNNEFVMILSIND